jgi:hypothetical protein
MVDGIVAFEVEISSMTQIRSRVLWPGAEGSWIEGGMEDMMVHFTYAGWTACNLGCMMSLVLASQDPRLTQALSEMMTRIIATMGAVQVAEIRLTREALDEIRRDRIEP